MFDTTISTLRWDEHCFAANNIQPYVLQQVNDSTLWNESIAFLFSLDESTYVIGFTKLYHSYRGLCSIVRSIMSTLSRESGLSSAYR